MVVGGHGEDKERLRGGAASVCSGGDGGTWCLILLPRIMDVYWYVC